MLNHSTRLNWVLVAMALALAGRAALAEGETYIGTAALAGGAAGKSSMPLTVIVRRYATSAEREALIAAVKKGGAGSAHTLLAKRDTIGTVDVGGRKTALKYAYAWDLDRRRRITLVAADPVAMPDVRHEPGYDVGFIFLDLDASGNGAGEFVPAAKVHVDEQNAIVTENSSAGMLQLTGITRK
jgi:hypothetical protein